MFTREVLRVPTRPPATASAYRGGAQLSVTGVSQMCVSDDDALRPLTEDRRRDAGQRTEAASAAVRPRAGDGPHRRPRLRSPPWRSLPSSSM
jgi:hypothetical protein